MYTSSEFPILLVRNSLGQTRGQESSMEMEEFRFYGPKEHTSKQQLPAFLVALKEKALSTFQEFLQVRELLLMGIVRFLWDLESQQPTRTQRHLSVEDTPCVTAPALSLHTPNLKAQRSSSAIIQTPTAAWSVKIRC